LSTVRDLQEVVAKGLCTGCGLCESIAGCGSVKMRVTSFGQIRPHVKKELKADTLARILAICPGASVTGPDRSSVVRDGEMHPVWGPIGPLYRGWASDEQVRHRAAAGGVLTALGCYLLQSGEVDAILHVKASTTDPVATDAQVSTTIEEVVAGAQSRYGPAAPLVHVHRLLAEGRRFAVIGKPCDASAIRNLAKIDSRVDEQIPYILTLFCGGVPNVQTAHKMAAYHGLTPEQIALFRWRGNGWPGTTHIEAKDRRQFDVDYQTAWFNPAMPWTYDIQFRCKICPDAIGEAADVACPDGWVMENGKPIYREAPGVNIAIPRTERGRRLVENAAAAGAITLEPFSVAELDRMHADHYQRKLENPGRQLGLTLSGEPSPAIRRYRFLATLLRAGPKMTWRELRGTLRRARGGANREPLD
jgi:coenzyme F420 hydrogenase subunit beta